MASSEHETPPKDPLSCANTHEYRLKHLVWEADFDFTSKTVSAVAELHFLACTSSPAPLLLLDTHEIKVARVSECENNRELQWELGKTSVLGTPLSIHLVSGMVSGEKRELRIRVEYRTSPDATALQWLTPEQTKGGNYGYLFTQCQSIHARSLLPCQDSPGVKFSYRAKLLVPPELTALMGAIPEGELREGRLLGASEAGKAAFSFHQPTPIPSYLVGLVVGNIRCREIGPRSRVWSEPELLDACAYEFGEIEEFLKCAESIAGPYIWGPCDLLVLPPSYPYGGMEHPCLIFVTPTLLAGDRSLTGVLVHEISHSWTGNLVTCATWDHFWLNEGFTVFLERKVISRLQSEALRHMHFLNGYSSLLSSVSRYGGGHEYTKLVPEIRAADPDDAFSSVPYEKGSCFFFYLESLVGGAEVFDPFIKAYVERFKGEGLVWTSAFKQFFLEFFSKEAKQGCFNDLNWDDWLFSPGMPATSFIPSCFDASLQKSCTELRDQWRGASEEGLSAVDGGSEIYSSLSPLQKQEFLSLLITSDPPLPVPRLARMRTLYKMDENKNSEIRFNWLLLCLKSDWEEMYPLVTSFLTEVGRMKFVRPLYRNLFKAQNGKDLAVQLFKDNRHIYHNICAIMVSKDLGLSS